MDTSNSNRGVKRKKNETPSEIHKRIKVPFACPHCLREYTNHPHLTAHIVNFHKKTETVENKDSTTFVTKLDDVIGTTEFIRRSMIANLEIKEAAKVNEVKLTKLRLGNFDEKNYELKNPPKKSNLQQRMALKWQEIITDILDQERKEKKDKKENEEEDEDDEDDEEDEELFQVLRAKHLRNRDIFDVYFSSGTNVSKIAQIIQLHCLKNTTTGRFVTQPAYPSTNVRWMILDTIGRKVCVDPKKSTYTIRFIEAIPHLVIKDTKYRIKCENEYTFSDAILKYKQMMTTQDFTEAYELCKKYGFVGAALNQFIIL